MTFLILPGAGFSGSAWAGVAEELGAVVLPVPDLGSVADMADAVAAQVAELDVTGPLVTVGASLGAVVALELGWRTEVSGMVAMAAGFGIRVGRSTLSLLDDAGPEVFDQVARSGLGHPVEEHVRARREDLASRADGVMYRQLAALREHRAREPRRVVPTVVFQGLLDRSVRPEDQLELAQRCGAVVRVLEEVGHSPYLEAPDEVVRWSRVVEAAAGR
ncbi:hypothetical protein GCM10009836_25560 [Pseudonocardia ailaonensis]|uniref:AB hydrolase-1 domain-containing protein n=1 Tax=Pseudonocardia ailaonensis TaxID=367279 RepID=A0ABN2MZ19_9PSEU